MKKLIVFVVVLAAVFAVTPLRERLCALTLPVLTRLGPVGDRLATPARRYSARNDLAFYKRLIESSQTEGRELPGDRTFAQWLRQRAPQDDGLDPWGNAYWLRRVRTGGWELGSNGPDGERDTPDDITERLSF
jgi:hypothetical protein